MKKPGFAWNGQLVSRRQDDERPLRDVLAIWLVVFLGGGLALVLADGRRADDDFEIVAPEAIRELPAGSCEAKGVRASIEKEGPLTQRDLRHVRNSCSDAKTEQAYRESSAAAAAAQLRALK